MRMFYGWAHEGMWCKEIATNDTSIAVVALNDSMDGAVKYGYMYAIDKATRQLIQQLPKIPDSWRFVI